MDVGVVYIYDDLRCYNDEVAKRRKTMIRRSPGAKVLVSRARIQRSVASSSAIEINERTEVIEKRLRSGNRRFANLTLAS